MTGPHPAVAATRVAVRAALRALAQEAEGGARARPALLVACSGGADSLALAAATAFEAPRAGFRAGAVIVDHGLQSGSATVAERAARQCQVFGLAPVTVVRVQVTAGGGPESAARTARYAAFEREAERLGERGDDLTPRHSGTVVVLAHTQSDQAEQVLLGLVRGSGARSLAGMPARRGRYVRPFLALPAATIREACAALDVEPWEDPHNGDERYLRVRARRMVAELEDTLGPGVVAGLARSARLLRADADALDAAAERAAATLGQQPWDVVYLLNLPQAVRTRVWRLLASSAGAPAGTITSTHVERLETLVLDWRGQDGVHLPGGVVIARVAGGIRARPPVH